MACGVAVAGWVFSVAAGLASLLVTPSCDTLGTAKGGGQVGAPVVIQIVVAADGDKKGGQQ